MRLKRARKELGLTALALSEAAGLGKSLVSILEGGGGRVPRLPTVERLADVLHLSPSFLAFGLDHPSEPVVELRSKGFADRLRAELDRRDLAVRALAELAGLSAGGAWALAHGTQPSLDTLEIVAKALGVSPAWLAYGEGPRELPKRGAKTAPAAVP
jgi:transcriptional regulator with XRE-family HTH domain